MATRRGRSLNDLVSGDLDDVQATTASKAEATPAPTPAGPEVVPVNVLVVPVDRKRLRQLSLDTGLSLQKLGHEAWNLLLQSRGLPPLKQVAANVPSGRRRRAPE